MFGIKQIRRILIIKECCIGDVLMTTPLVSSIKKTFPDSTIDYMVGSWSKEIIASNGFINKTIDHIKFNLKNLPKLFRLRKKKYDLIFQCDVGLRPALQAFLIGAKYRIGFNYNHKGFLFTKRFERRINDLHEIESYLELGKLANIVPITRRMTFSLSSSSLHWASETMQDLGMYNGQVIAIFPGGGYNPGTVMPSKRWNAEKYGELAKKLNQLLGYQILVLGSKNDAKVILDVQSICESAKHVETASIADLAAIISKCKLFICNDCGPMHLAAALGIPTLSIWGPTDPKLLAPIGKIYRYIQSKVDCSPCYKQILGTFEKCDTFNCMDSIKVDEVYKLAVEMLGD